jgi:hypothetical protein
MHDTLLVATHKLFPKNLMGADITAYLSGRMA